MGCPNAVKKPLVGPEHRRNCSKEQGQREGRTVLTPRQGLGPWGGLSVCWRRSTPSHSACQEHTVVQKMGLWSLDEQQSPAQRPWGCTRGCSGLSLLSRSGLQAQGDGATDAPCFGESESWGVPKSLGRMLCHSHPSRNTLQVICVPGGNISHVLQARPQWNLSFL